MPDYQLAAFCMAVFFRGLTSAETLALTDAMVASGETVDLGGALGRKRRRQALDRRRRRQDVDRRRPDRRGVRRAVREDERPRPRAHRRDARQARVDPRLPRRARRSTSSSRRCATSGSRSSAQTADLVPADKKLYALRDVTATVDNVSLIAASIMSKKIAAGADAIVLDVKVGDGAFMKTLEDARILAEAMLDLGTRAGREVVCLLTDMDQPLGHAVGNALEMREAVATLRGEGPPDFTELVARRRARGCSRSPISGSTRPRARGAPRQALADGSARRGVRALDPRRRAATRARTRCRGRPSSCAGRRAAGGLRARASARSQVGLAALHLGAGRRTKDDAIDHAVGIVCRRKRGDEVGAGELLAEVHARDEASAARGRARGARGVRARRRAAADALDPARRPVVASAAA